MNCFIRHFILPIALLGTLHAQTPDSVLPEEEQVSLQFRLMAWLGDVPALNYGRHQKIELTETATVSEIQTYSGPITLKFTTAVEKPDPRKPAPVVASVLLPKDSKRVTLLTVPAGRARYAMYVIPEDPAGLPAKHTRIHNLTTDRLLVALGTNGPIELAPATSVIATAEGAALVIRVARKTNGQWRELFNNVVEMSDTGGPNIMLIHGQQGAGLGMFAVPLWPATKPETSAATP
ncbi:MAG: hypothetical protein K0R17_139 [Rariglobus sp.]|jgi:hypothetical protein|nr:hypothetical protein [Rariglobus sp.]